MSKEVMQQALDFWVAKEHHLPVEDRHAWSIIASALRGEFAKPALVAVPKGWRNSQGGHDWPTVGKKYLIRIGPDLTLQNEVYEFDKGDDGFGGGEYFWTRDDVDECPPSIRNMTAGSNLAISLTCSPPPRHHNSNRWTWRRCGMPLSNCVRAVSTPGISTSFRVS